MRVAVLDVGKTNAKAVVVDTGAGAEIVARTIPNRVVADGPYPHFDTDAVWAFFVESLAAFQAEAGFSAISVTAHGAAAALLSGDRLAMPVLDYEHAYPARIVADYDAMRPPFATTYSPRLPGGLNIGAQLHYQQAILPDAFAAADTIVTYPQYWSWRLTGVAATEATSLACHTDLWAPARSTFSSLADTLGVRGRFAHVRSAFDTLGRVRPELARRLGDVPVHCGIHDSNASLLPHLVGRAPPFAVISTGTWVILFAVGGDLQHLDPARDTLANVDAYGRPVPSARYMGGREFELLTHGEGAATPAAVHRVLEQRLIIGPGTIAGSGPFPAATIPAPADLDPDERFVAASLHAALMTRTSLRLIGAAGTVIVEGPFARNRLYLEALAAAVGRPVLAVAGSTGTSLGAAFLADPEAVRPAPVAAPDTGLAGAAFDAWATAWEDRVAKSAGHRRLP